MQQALALARERRLVTFGMQSTKPATGHGEGDLRRQGHAAGRESIHVYTGRNEASAGKSRSAASLFLVEVQSGSYLGEDDIVRFEDVYKRA